MIAIPTIRHSITTAFFCDLFLITSVVKIGTTNQITNPIIMGTILILKKDIGEEALFIKLRFSTHMMLDVFRRFLHVSAHSREIELSHTWYRVYPCVLDQHHNRHG